MELITRSTPLRSFKYRLAAVGFTLLNLVSIYRLLQLADGTGLILGHFSTGRIVRLLPVAVMALIGLFIMIFGDTDPFRSWIEEAPERIIRRLSILGPINWLIWLVFLVAYPLLQISTVKPAVQQYFPDYWLYAMFSLAGGLSLRTAWRRLSLLQAWIATLALMTAVYTLSFYAVTVTNDPFSLTWSEGSQLYLASTFLSRWIYGFRTPLPVIKPGYEVLMSIPYLIRGLPIWVHRLWLVFLWTGFTLGTALAIRRTLRISDIFQSVVFAASVFAYLLNIPVYFDLLTAVFLVLFGFASKKPAARWAAVITASAWVGICKINWFPLPGMLAAVIYILENRWEGRGLRYFLQPAAWILAGTATAFAINWIYMVESGNPLYYFSTTYSSAMLWYRLFPSATNPIGVFSQALLYSLPLVGLLLYALIKGKAWHLMRVVSLGAILAVFFVGGLVVSVKIGGGNNIHNLDAFFTLLVVVTAYTVFGRFIPDGNDVLLANLPLQKVALVVVNLCLLTVLPFKLFVTYPPHKGASQAITMIQKYVDQVSQQHDAQILFTTERQLISMGMIKNVTLVPEYEKKFLMEMALCENQPYYSKVHKDIWAHRFALIVTEPLFSELLGKDFPFGEENDVYVKNFTQFLLDEYEPIASLPDYGVVLYIPKSR